MQDHKRLPALFPANFHVSPSQLRPNPSAKCFRNRLLRGEPGRQKWSWRFVGDAVADLVWMQDTIQEPVAKPVIRRLNPGDLDNVNADAEDHAPHSTLRRSPPLYERISFNISSTAVVMPAMMLRLTMLWPMFNSTR